MNSIRIKNLKKRFDKFVIDISDLEIPSGCIVGIIGENAAGKTTLLKMIAGAERADFGSINLFDKNLETLNPEELQKIGIVFEDVNFPTNMKIKQVGTFCSMCFLSWDSSKFNELLTTFDIASDIKVSALSKGMKAKLFLAIALCHNSGLLLLDETLSGLDPLAKDKVLKIISEFIEDEENTVLISSNVVSDFEKNTDYILYLCDGEVKFFESIEYLRENYVICDYDDLKDIEISKECIIGIRQNNFSNDTLIDMSKTNGKLKIASRKATIEEIVIFMGGNKDVKKSFL